MNLPCQIVDDPTPEHIFALRKRIKLSRQKFADRLGLDTRPCRIGNRATELPIGRPASWYRDLPPEIDARLDLE